MKKILAVELNGGLLNAGAGEPLTRLQTGVLYWLGKLLRETDSEAVLVTGSAEVAALLPILENQGVKFVQVVDSFTNVNATGAEVWIIGSPVRGNSINPVETGWEGVYRTIKGGLRKADHRRKTNETDIAIKLNLDGTGKASIDTGLHFFNHMLDQIARHGSIDLDITAKGDLHIDEHHTIEDTAIALGEAFALALGDKRGIERYGFCLPMDDALAQVAIDFGGRNWIVWEAAFTREKVGDVPTEMFFHFFKSFTDAARCNLNVKAEGSNEHHKIEAIFKAFARAIKMAVRRDLNNMQLPTTKGML
jgi:imidazoleglycerol-phosphate dehydratase/histidinol-phosphatase